MGKRDLLIQQKRPTNATKETYSYSKRDLLIQQKRPTHTAKETYSYSKRDLLKQQKRSTDQRILRQIGLRAEDMRLWFS